MFNLDTTDVLEAVASVDAVIKFTISGHDATDGVISNHGIVANTDTALYTAVGVARIYSVTFYNSHSAAVTITLNKDPADAGTLYPFFSVSLGIGYSLLFDGINFSVFDASGNLQIGASVSDIAYDVTAWDGVTAIAPSKNAVRDALLQTLLTAQGDIVYASAANVLARLAKGAAGTKLFINAGGTAPEWTSGIKVGTFTRDMSAASGDVDYTGIGFKPSVIIFFGGISLSFINTYIGFDDGTKGYALYNYGYSIPGQIAWRNTASILLATAAGVFQSAFIKTFNADGFTLTWAKNGTPGANTATMFYLAIR